MLADTLPFVMPDTSSCATASPAAWIWPTAVLEPTLPACGTGATAPSSAGTPGHDRRLAGTLWSPVMDPAHMLRTQRRRRLGGDDCRRFGWFLSQGRSGPGR